VRLTDRWTSMDLAKEAVTGGARRKRVCEVMGISVRTMERWEKEPEKPDQRRGPKTVPKNKLTENECREVLRIATCPEFRDSPPVQIVPRLADRGEYVASESTFYRLLRAAKLLAHRGRAKAPARHRPDPHVATGPRQVWSWDITYLRSRVAGIFFYLYLVMDVYSRKIVGWEIFEKEDSAYASQVIEEACRREGVRKDELVLHADNGGPMKGSTLLVTLQKLGVTPSFSRPSVSDDNAFSESLFRTVKYCPQFPDGPLDSVQEWRVWMTQFERWYDTSHLHSEIQYVTPEDRHNGRDIEILARRKRVYEEAKKRNPERWSRGTRNWEPITVVRLNPRKVDLQDDHATDTRAA
jgi:putative transposase